MMLKAPRGSTIETDGRTSWLDARRSVIGASDSAGIFGVGYANQSAVTVWESKVYPPREDESAAFAKRLRIGKLMEPALRAIFEDETGLEVIDPGEFTIYRHADIPYIGATLDGECEHDEYGRCVVELKNVSNFARHEWDGDEPPLKFQVQVQHQLAVTGASHGFLLGLIGGNEPVIKVIERNESFIEAMLARLAEFWVYVQRRELPPVDDSDATAAALARLWPEDSGRTVFGPDEAANWFREREESKAVIKAQEARCTLAENKIKAAIGDASYIEAGGQRYSWKQQSRAGHFVKASTFRVLRKCK